MSTKEEMAFDVCWEVYRGAKEVMEAKRGISALKPEDVTKFLWRPDFRPRLTEWVTDFALAGKAALDGPRNASRIALCPGWRRTAPDSTAVSSSPSGASPTIAALDPEIARTCFLHRRAYPRFS